MDIVCGASAAVQVLPKGVIPIWNAIIAGIENVAHSATITPTNEKFCNEQHSYEQHSYKILKDII